MITQVHFLLHLINKSQNSLRYRLGSLGVITHVLFHYHLLLTIVKTQLGTAWVA